MIVDSDKTVLITGSSKGIGLSIADKFALNGNKVVINSRDKFQLKKICKRNKNFIGIDGDVTDAAIADNIVKKAINSMGKLDIVICNVGSGASVKPGFENNEEWEKMLSINLFSTINIVQSSKKYLAKTKGNIICISSICGHEVVPGAPITYSVSKAALNAYIKGISRPLGDLNIRINGISPGNIYFSGSVWEKKLKENKSFVEDFISKNVALKKLGTPEDVSNLVFYLCSSMANFVTGSIWCVDGGQIRN